MKILEVIGTLAPSYGGPAIATPALCRALADRGNEVELFAVADGSEAQTSVDSQEATRNYGIKRFRVYGPMGYGASPSMARQIAETVPRCDVVHIHSVYGFHTVAAATACRRSNVPYVISPHGALDQYHWRQKRWKKAPYEWLIEGRNLSHAQILRATSEREKQCFLMLGLKPEIRVVPQGVAPPDVWTAGESQVRIMRDSRLILSIGRLTAKKRLDILIDAIGIVSQREKVRLVIAGPEEQVIGRSLRAQVARLGLGEIVKFVGPVYGDEKWRLLSRAGIFALPSEDESFGVAVAEAMTAGVPVVVSRGVALHVEVEAVGAGIIVDGTSASVARAIDHLIREPDTAVNLGARGQEFARRNLLWPTVAERTEEMFLDAAALLKRVRG